LKQGDERVLARVHDEYLLESELKAVIPPGTAVSDSLMLARSFIDNWIRQRLIVQQARNNLTEEQMDFSRQLENYTNSLIIYTYENELVRQKLDTIISDEEIQQYYEANKENFRVKDNLVRIRYIKLPLNAKETNGIRRLFKSNDQDAKDRLADQCDHLGAEYYLDGDEWLLFTNVLKEIPIITYNQEEFLRNHIEVEAQDSLCLYLVRFIEYRLKEAISPMEVEKQRIRDIILNKRKIKLLHQMEEDVYQNALKKTDFEIY
jgi:hypothetical protein